MILVPYQHSIFIDLYGFHPCLGVNSGLMLYAICIYGTFFFEVLNSPAFLAHNFDFTTSANTNSKAKDKVKINLTHIPDLDC